MSTTNVVVKADFTLSAIFADALKASGLNADNIERAVKATIAKGEVVKSENKLGNVKIVKSKEDKEVLNFRTTSGLTFTFEGNADLPSMFSAFHDSQLALWKKHGTPEKFTIDGIPAKFTDWLAKFPLAKPAKPAAPISGSTGKPASNGVNRNTSPVVETTAV